MKAARYLLFGMFIVLGIVACGKPIIEDIGPGGGDDDDDDTTGTVSFASEVVPAFGTATCTSSAACHDTGGSPEFAGDCNTVYGTASAYANTGDPPNSELLIQATGGNGHTGGAPIAAGDTEYNLFETWISEGATNDCP